MYFFKHDNQLNMIHLSMSVIHFVKEVVNHAKAMIVVVDKDAEKYFLNPFKKKY